MLKLITFQRRNLDKNKNFYHIGWYHYTHNLHFYYSYHLSFYCTWIVTRKCFPSEASGRTLSKHVYWHWKHKFFVCKWLPSLCIATLMHSICDSKYQCNNSNLILTKSMSKECKHINMSDIRTQPYTHIHRHSHISIITRFEYKNYIVNDFEWLVCISILHFYVHDLAFVSMCILMGKKKREKRRFNISFDILQRNICDCMSCLFKEKIIPFLL